jgi:DNA (cytosine-5)-methyltransferase 1
LKFIDFFSGAGMFRKGMELAGHNCIGYVEWDKHARNTYETNFNTENEWTEWDVTKVNADDIPQAEIWTFGFPCKNFSTANAVSRYGLRGEQSGLFMNMIGLLHEVEDKPQYLFIENVKGFTTLNGGSDFLYALTLIHKLNYDIKYEISSAIEYDVPQNRIRTYLVCKLNDNQVNQDGSTIQSNKNVDINGINVYELNDLVQQQSKKIKISWGKKGSISNGICTVDSYEPYPINLSKHLSNYLEVEIDNKQYLSEEQIEKIQYMKGSKEKQLPDGRIWKEGAVPFPDSIDRYARCVTPSDGSLNRSTHVIKDGKGYRKLTTRERARLQHLDDSFVFPVSDSQASLQLGNGVCVKVIKEIAERWIK